MLHIRELRRLGGVIVMLLALVLLVPQQAQASTWLDGLIKPGQQHYYTQCGTFWPQTGEFQTTHVDGDGYYITFNFQLTQAQINSLACVDPYLEIDFVISGFNVPFQWDGYSVSSDIPGAIHDTALSDFGGHEASPAVTDIQVKKLQANHQYSATISFNLPAYTADGKGGPRVDINWEPSYWATFSHEESICHLGLPIWGPAICIFGNFPVFLSNGYTGGQSLPFNGYRIWDFSPAIPVTSTPPTEDATATPIQPNYTADRTVLHGPDGTLYIMAGGAKFPEGSWSEFVGMGYSTAGMVDVSSDTLNSIPNVPRDGTILQGGGGQLYVVAGGARFYFGSMAEYYGQGYANGQWVNVPQAPLNAIGDAPGNVPSDGTVLQHPNGSLYVILGGVKFYFGSMQEFTGLGYSTGQIDRVSGAPLDAIPSASNATPPRDGTILRSGGGQIYIVAGGAKFQYSSMDEYQSLGPQAGDWVNVPQGSLDAVSDAPGNRPRNGTVLRSGGGQVYVVAGGAKFYFSSMTEYYNQGHTDAQIISTPQAPLDGIGDTPGNMPTDGTIVQRPDGSLYVIAGGVRWAFGSMQQYYGLGYSNAQVVRVSQAPLDGINDVSATNLPTGGLLLQGSDATVWVMKNGQRRSFTSAQQVTDLGYSWSNLIRVPDGPLAAIPNGGNLP